MLKLSDSEISRFWTKVHPSPVGCWMWMGRLNEWGYGEFDIYRGGTSKSILAHRAAFLLRSGLLDSDLLVCHTCDNPACVRWDHLYQGTNKDNSRDRELRGRGGNQRGENNGNSKLSYADVVNIRRALIAGVKGGLLSDQYGVTRQAIWQIKHNLKWASQPEQ